MGPPRAMVKIAMDLLDEGMRDEQEALLMLEPNKLDELDNCIK